MKIAFALGLSLSLSLVAGRASGWDNLFTHPDLVRFSATAALEGSVDIYLRKEFGLERGIDEVLAVQYGFGPKEVDDDLRDQSRSGDSEQMKPARLDRLPEALRQELKAARLRRGWSQLELGRRVGLPQAHVSAIETGKIVPHFDTLLDLVRVLDRPRPRAARAGPGRRGAGA